MPGRVSNVYSVIVNGDLVFTGSYGSCMKVYEAFSMFKSNNPTLIDVISIAFSPKV